jgi:hypothetical protein
MISDVVNVQNEGKRKLIIGNLCQGGSEYVVGEISNFGICSEK